MRLIPEMSTTEFIIKMSDEPMKCPTEPEASVLTITFGTPIGSARIAAVAIVVPADPPRPKTPVSFPSACQHETSAAAPSAAFVTA